MKASIIIGVIGFIIILSIIIIFLVDYSFLSLPFTVGVGGSCNQIEDCNPGLTCSIGKCRIPNGGSCFWNKNQCVSGSLCHEGACTNSIIDNSATVGSNVAGRSRVMTSSNFPTPTTETRALVEPAVLEPIVSDPTVLEPIVSNPTMSNPTVLGPAVLDPTQTGETFTQRNVPLGTNLIDVTTETQESMIDVGVTETSIIGPIEAPSVCVQPKGVIESETAGLSYCRLSSNLTWVDGKLEIPKIPYLLTDLEYNQCVKLTDENIADAFYYQEHVYIVYGSNRNTIHVYKIGDDLVGIKLGSIRIPFDITGPLEIVYNNVYTIVDGFIWSASLTNNALSLNFEPVQHKGRGVEAKYLIANNEGTYLHYQNTELMPNTYILPIKDKEYLQVDNDTITHVKDMSSISYERQHPYIVYLNNQIHQTDKPYKVYSQSNQHNLLIAH